MIIEAALKALKIEDKSGWPVQRQFRVQHDENGLPAVDWLEHQLTSPQACFASVGENGIPMFVACDVGSVRRSRWKSASPGFWGVLAIAAFFALPAIAMFLRTQDYRYGDDTPPMMVFVSVMFMQIFIAFAGFLLFALWRLIKMKRGSATPATEEFTSAPWAQLQAFIVTNERAMSGVAEKDENGKDIEPSPVLLAHFGGDRGPIVVTAYHWSPAAMEQLHGILTREFIDRRADYLERMNSAARAARNEAVGPRRKVV